MRGPGQTWSTPRAPLISKLLSVGGCFDKRGQTTESQPNCRSVSGAITIIVQEVGITNSLGGYLLISDGWSSLGINCLQWLIIIAKDTTLSLSCTPQYLAKVRRKESCNEAILCQFINTEDLVIVQQLPLWY